MRTSFVVGWLIIIAIVTPVVAAYFVWGPDGPLYVAGAYLGVTFLVLLSMLAVSIGELLR